MHSFLGPDAKILAGKERIKIDIKYVNVYIGCKGLAGLHFKLQEDGSNFPAAGRAHGQIPLNPFVKEALQCKRQLREFTTPGRDGHPSTDAVLAWVLIMDNLITM